MLQEPVTEPVLGPELGAQVQRDLVLPLCPRWDLPVSDGTFSCAALGVRQGKEKPG